MDKQILREIGLSEGEIKVYLALLKLGVAKKTELAKQAGVSSSKVYEICSRLQNKGVVGTILKDNKKNFQAMEPSRLMDFFNDKTARIETQRKELETELVYYKGFLDSVEKKLSNERFVQNAKPEVVDLERKKKADALEKINMLEESLRFLV